jgi:pimeloyl-[acyl-carrier protein] synthase
MTTAKAPQFNPLDPRLAEDPYEVYREFLRLGPVRYEPAFGACFVFGHAEGRQVVREPGGDLRFVEFQRGRLPAGRDPADQPYCRGLADFVVAKNGEDHRRVRGAFARHFTPGRVDSLRSFAEERTNELIDGFAGRGRIELMEELAVPLPLAVISSLLGVSDRDRQRIAEHLLYFTRAIQFLPLTEAELERVNAGFTGLTECFAEIIADRRTHPGDDLLSMLVAEADAGKLTEGELAAAAWGLYAAGHETTASSIGLAVVTLLRHPEQLERLRADPELIPAAVEELLRHRGLTQAVHRIFPEPVTICDVVVPAGTPVVVYVASANHDERWCPHAERFDIGREGPMNHLTFGDGPHKCPGQHLARATLEVVLGAMLRRLPNLRLDGVVEWNTKNLPLLPPERIPLAWDVESTS